ncbi:MAG: hypothetical protein RIQ79_2220 [Verrucomicrobiota bacterium]
MSAPTITAYDVERLVDTLGALADWATAAQLSTILWGADNEGNKRRVRALASAAGSGVVSYPGSKGYKLWKLCTGDELHHCINAYTTQTDDMRRRRDLYRARLHREHPVPATRFQPDPSLRPSTEQLALL